MGISMEELSGAVSTMAEPIAERDIVSLVAMLDYLIGEIAKVDTMSASWSYVHARVPSRRAVLGPAPFASARSRSQDARFPLVDMPK